jgi:hypothetical protein
MSCMPACCAVLDRLNSVTSRTLVIVLGEVRSIKPVVVLSLVHFLVEVTSQLVPQHTAES